MKTPKQTGPRIRGTGAVFLAYSMLMLAWFITFAAAQSLSGLHLVR